MQWRSVGLRVLLLAVVAAAALPAFIIILCNGAEQRQAAVQTADQATLSLFQVAQERVRSHVEIIRSLLVGLAAEDSVITKDPVPTTHIFQQVLAEHHLLSVLVLVGADGRRIASSSPTLSTAPPPTYRRWFREALARRRFVIGEYVISNNSRRPTIHGALPVFDPQRQVCGILNAGIDLDRLRDALNHERLASDSSLVVTDHAGVILVAIHDPGRVGDADPLIIANHELGEEPRVVEQGGRRFLIAGLRIPGGDGCDFQLRLGIPLERYAAAAQHTTVRNLSWLIAAVILAGTITWWLGGWLLVRPLNRVVEVADAIAAGERERRVGHVGQPVELQRLARSFDAMTGELHQHEIDLRITLQSIGDGVIATDVQGRVTRMNRVAETLTGWSEGDARGKPLEQVFIILNAQTRQPVPNPVARVLALGRLVGLANHTVLRHRDGGERQIADSAAPIQHPDGRMVGVVLVFRDTSERYLLEEQLRQAQKLDAIGQLAGGIAHDFNNILTAIMGSAEQLAQRAAGGGDSQSIKRILDAVTRASELTGKLLSFSRRSTRREAQVDLHGEIATIAALLTRTIDRNIAIDCDLRALSGRIIGDSALIQSALLNLALNARDAMAGGGRLTFSTRTVAGDDPLLSGHGLPPLPHIALSVADTGSGIPAAVRAHLFEPFVTTKPIGKGTGLGLPSVYGMVKAHHGAIAVESAEGRGTTFTIFLQEVPEGAPSPAAGSSGPVPALSLAGCTVLIADDEEPVREVLAAILGELGATVVAVADGDLAVAAVTAAPDRFHLVILDHVMPKRSGRDAFLAIHALRPGLPCFIASGYAHDVEVSALERQGLGGFLAKPFRRHDVMRLLAGWGQRSAAGPAAAGPASS